MKNVPEISCNNILLSQEITSILEKRLLQYLRSLWIKNFKKEKRRSKSAVPSCSSYLARVMYKFHLNSWNTECSQSVTCVCKNVLSVNYILLECPITTELFQKNEYDFNACNSVKNSLCNTDVVNLLINWLFIVVWVS